MKSYFKILVLALIVPMFVLTGCKKDEDVANKHLVVVDYLKANNLDLPAILSATSGWAISASALNTTLADYYIIDLRSAAAFASGRITGAVNSTVANVITTANQAPAGKKIMLVCATGQNAAFALAALKLSGKTNVFFLKWGMSAWNSSLDNWTANIGNLTNSNIVTPASFATNVESTKLPLVVSTSTDASTILNERIAAVLAEGLKTVTASAVLANPSNYFIHNFWTAPNVTDNGNRNIVGAYRISPLTLATNEFKFLNPDKQIVTYCWTGQTSAAISFYLRVLGYDAYGMIYGANAMWNSALASNKWPEGQQNFTLVTQ